MARSLPADEETRAAIKRAQNREHVRAFRQRAKIKLAEQKRAEAEAEKSRSTSSVSSSPWAEAEGSRPMTAASSSPNPTDYAISRYSDLAPIDQQFGILESLIHDARKVVAVATIRDNLTVCKVDPIIRSALFCATLRCVAYLRDSEALAASARVAYQDTLQRLQQKLAWESSPKASDVAALTVSMTALSNYATLDGIPDVDVHVSGRLAVFSQASQEAFQTPWTARVLETFWVPYLEEAMLERRKSFMDSEAWRKLPIIEENKLLVAVPGLIEECDQVKRSCDDYQGVQSMSALCDTIRNVVQKCYIIINGLCDELKAKSCGTDPEDKRAVNDMEHYRAFAFRLIMILAYNTRRLREQVMVPVFPEIPTSQLPDTQGNLDYYASELFRSVKIMLELRDNTSLGYSRGMVKHLESLRQHYTMGITIGTVKTLESLRQHYIIPSAQQSSATELQFCNQTLEQIKNDKESVLSYHWGQYFAGTILPQRRLLTTGSAG